MKAQVGLIGLQVVLITQDLPIQDFTETEYRWAYWNNHLY